MQFFGCHQEILFETMTLAPREWSTPWRPGRSYAVAATSYELVLACLREACLSHKCVFRIEKAKLFSFFLQKVQFLAPKPDPPFSHRARVGVRLLPSFRWAISFTPRNTPRTLVDPAKAQKAETTIC